MLSSISNLALISNRHQDDFSTLHRIIQTCQALVCINPIQNRDELEKNLNWIVKHIYHALGNNSIHLFSNEIIHLKELHKQITFHLNVKSSEITRWLKLFDWLFLVFDQNNYVKILFNFCINSNHLSQISLTHCFTHFIEIQEDALNLPWQDFSKKLSPLIRQFFSFDSFERSLYVLIPGRKKFNFNEFLVFLESHNASPKELTSLITCKSNKQTLSYSQAEFRIAFNYSAPFPEELDFKNHSDLIIFKTGFLAKRLLKKEYEYYLSDELFFSLKVLDKYYKGNPKLLFEYQNIYKHLKFDQPGIKTFGNPNKKKIRQFASAFSGKNQTFVFKNGDLSERSFTPKMLNFFLNSNLKFKKLIKRKIKILDASNKVHSVEPSVFIGIIYPSLVLPFDKKTALHKMIVYRKEQKKQLHKIHCSTQVINEIKPIFKQGFNKAFNLLEDQDKIDVDFLLSRSTLSPKVNENLLDFPLEKQQWKNAFKKWVFSYEQTL